MRTVTLAFLAGVSFIGLSAAQAADLDYGVLRGPDYESEAPIIDWNGVYFGGHAGYSTTSFDFDNAGRSEIARILRNTTVESEFNVSTWNKLRPGRGHDLSFGGFFGYNVQFDDTVFGVEFDYTSSNQKSQSSDSISRFVTTSTGYFTDVFAQTEARATLQDYATIRARGGYAIGQFMPFATGGIALGRALVGSNVAVRSFQYTDSTRTTQVGAIAQTGGDLKEKFALGFAVGAGIDYSITPNVFLRAEYQYVLFDEFGDHRMHVSTIRSALGVKF